MNFNQFNIAKSKLGKVIHLSEMLQQWGNLTDEQDAEVCSIKMQTLDWINLLEQQVSKVVPNNAILQQGMMTAANEHWKILKNLENTVNFRIPVHPF